MADILTALPVFNEERHVADVLQHVLQQGTDVLVVDDGSKDRTAEIVEGIPGVRMQRHAVNQGYGAALRTAFDYAVRNGYKTLVTIDCDGQHQPELIRPLVDSLYPANAPAFDIASGSRYLEVFPDNSLPPAERRLINADVTEVLNQRLGLNLTDGFCGFKAYRVCQLKRLQITELGYAMPLQLWVQAATLNMRIVEFPVPLIYLDEDRSFGGALDDAARRRRHYLDIIEQNLQRAATLQFAENGCGG